MITHPNTKINLGLHVLRVREDGYHDIETVFVPYFALQDTLEVVRGDDYSRTLAGLVARYGQSGEGFREEGPAFGESGVEEVSGQEFVERAPEAAARQSERKKEFSGLRLGAGDAIAEEACGKIRQGIAADGKCMITVAREEGVDWDPAGDLCVQAYAALDADFSLPPVKIFLEKTAPVGAGLGSGSADAAFTLRMLSQMFDLGLNDETLARYAARLGSDCAFFIWNRSMLGRGRGEILSPVELPQLEHFEIEVVAPQGIHISTAEAYRGVLPREDRPDLMEALSGPVERWRETVDNDFEPSVFARHPQLAAVKQSLYDAGAIYAAMSGSGSALFSLFPKGSSRKIF